MGYWSPTNSYDSDACHDILDKLKCDKDYPETDLIEHLLSYHCLPSNVDTDYDLPQELYLGIVMWGLHHGVVVARKRLTHARNCAVLMINDKEYLARWKAPKKRLWMIRGEIVQIDKWLNLTPKEFNVQKALGRI
ncbi:hypothetical protein LCGC14_1129090 [marine sediment metagenome]|uniref:Uncharacterized protein n=1 Tax=marine sediment metagenome TaxID=412755 RepID=A0A0F9Q7J2_9ZZZZ|nr:hypothetical protein [Methylophaga sp.]